MPQNPLEKFFEGVLWKSRLLVMLAVISAIFGAVGCFLVGTADIFRTFGMVITSLHQKIDHSLILIGIIGALDLFLIGIVLLIFSFGVYELFVSKLDEAHTQKELKLLTINSLDELKSRVLQVIVVVMIVAFFKVVLTMEFKAPLESLFFAVSIGVICLGVFLLRRNRMSD